MQRIIIMWVENWNHKKLDNKDSKVDTQPRQLAGRLWLTYGQDWTILSWTDYKEFKVYTYVIITNTKHINGILVLSYHSSNTIIFNTDMIVDN